MGGGSLGGGDHFGVGCFGATKGDIVPDRSAEEVGFLQHQTDLRTQAVNGYFPHILTINQHGPRAYVVKAGQQIDDAGLAATRRAKQRHRLPRLGDETHALQHRVAAEVAKRDLAELHLARNWRQRTRPRLVGNLALGVKHFKNTARRSAGLRHHTNHKTQLTEWEENIGQIQAKLLVRAQIERTVKNLPPAEIENGGLPNLGHQKDNREEKSEDAVHPELLLHQGGSGVVEALLLVALAGERLDHLEAGHIFLENGIQG